MMISNERLHKAMRERRAIKHFEASFEVPASDRDYILHFAQDLDLGLATLPLRICRVTDKALREQIREVGYNQPQHTGASELWVVCIDTDVLAQDNNTHLRDQAMFYGAAYSQALMVAAASLGYDSCPMIGFKFAAVSELISLPDNYVLCNFVVFGKRNKAPLPRGSKLSLNDILFTNELAQR
ncbi:nitroreductase family protein [Pseudoalteromonas fenneropenaei]|uniref:Nitroreductase family protein n=1 Tax=Pseudoalteromonas fenneropenaei TaxID=1737459 RepID=A0ABV7CPL1_9GAMM